VDPVDPRTALLGCDRTCCTKHEHRRAIAPGIEDAHHAVQQTDVAMQDASHRFAGGFGVAVRDRDRMVFVQAKDDAGILVAEVVNEAVVKSAIARAWVEANKRDVKSAEHLRGDVAAPRDLVVGFAFDLVQLHVVTRFLFVRCSSLTAVIQRRRWQTAQPCNSSTR
jgi:hypothetical protein